MWWKNPKLWGAVAAIIFTAVSLLTGVDFKKVVCGGEAPAVAEVEIKN
jgi:hypothetical protein